LSTLIQVVDFLDARSINKDEADEEGGETVCLSSAL
jgi:hypothetical protein